MAECGQLVEPKTSTGKPGPGASYPCSLQPRHDGPCWATEVKSSYGPREAYNKSVRDLPFPDAPPLGAFQGKGKTFGWDPRFGDGEPKGTETVWAEVPNFQEGKGQSSVPGMNPKPTESETIRDYKEAVNGDAPPEDPGQTGDTGEVTEPQTNLPGILMSPEEATAKLVERARVAQHAYIDLAHSLQALYASTNENVPGDIRDQLEDIRVYLFDGAGG